MQRLALFDLDNTLIDLDTAFRIWVQEFVDKRGLGPAAVDELIALGSRYPHRDTFFGRVRESFELDDPVAEMWAEYRRRMPYLVTCRPAVLDGLVTLRAAGWKVAIVTNGMADNQLGKIRQTGLEQAIDAYALSGAEGIHKPDPGLFEIAAKRCGLPIADGGWMVGDNLVADIAGGQAAGLRAIWIDRRTWPGQEHEADHVVTDVVQAIEILLAIEADSTALRLKKRSSMALRARSWEPDSICAYTRRVKPGSAWPRYSASSLMDTPLASVALA